MSVFHSIERQSNLRSGIAHGGIGAGSIEFRADGCTTNWNIFNNQPFGRGPAFPYQTHNMLFFKLRVQVKGKKPSLFLLQIEESHDVAGLSEHEYQYIFPWLKTMDSIDTEESFPFTDYDFRNDEMPLRARLRVWSPFVPFDVKNSSLPGINFDFRIESLSDLPVDVVAVMCCRNPVGYDLEARDYSASFVLGDGYSRVDMSSPSVSEDSPTWGQLSMGVDSENAQSSLGWAHPHPYYEELLRGPGLSDFDDSNGKSGIDVCYNSVGLPSSLSKSGDLFEPRFTLTWYFPNNYSKPKNLKCNSGYLELDRGDPAVEVGENRIEGVGYSRFFANSSEVFDYLVQNHEELKSRTSLFHSTFFRSTICSNVLDTINAQLNTLRSSAWLTADGGFGIIEGLNPYKNFAGLATTDVAMYGSIATLALFPELDKRVWIDHGRFQAKNGVIAHSITYNFLEIDDSELSGLRIDLPAQYAVQALRAYRWSGDKEYLLSIWPNVCAALEYGLKERDLDGDGLPDMDGIMCSYDNFPMYGVAPYVATQWLAALKLGAEVAKEVGDADRREAFLGSFRKGLESVERNCWSGSYYKLYSDPANGREDRACMTDQLFGQWASILAGAGLFIDKKRVSSALDSIVKNNFFDDQGLRNCTWPGDAYLHAVSDDCWVDQGNTCWSGVEFAFASFLIFAGKVEEGVEVVRHVDNRYRSYGMYWDHQEFGGHYYRPMSAWSIIEAFLGHERNLGRHKFSPKLSGGRLETIYTVGNGYGFLAVEIKSESFSVEFEQVSGPWVFESLELNFDDFTGDDWKLEYDGDCSVSLFGSTLSIDPLDGSYRLLEGHKIEVSATHRKSSLMSAS